MSGGYASAALPAESAIRWPAGDVDSPGTTAQVWRDLARIAAVFALGSLLYWIGEWALCGRACFPLDDSFIHVQFARNLFHDGQMAFNRGVPSSGSTAPAYPMLVAGFYFLFRDWYVASFALGAMCSLGTAWMVYCLLLDWTGLRDLARWGGVLTVFMNPTIIQAYSGMESAAYSLLFLVAIWLYGRDRRRLAASGCLALGVWLRPEFMIFLPLVCLERLIAWRRRPERSVPALLGEWAAHGFVWVVIVATFTGYNWLQDGHLLPTTFTAKHVVHQISKPVWLDGLPAAIRHRNFVQALIAIFIWPTLLLFLAGLSLATLCAPLAFGIREGFLTAWSDIGPRAAARRLAIISLVGYPYLRGFVDVLGVVWFQGQRYFAILSPLLVIIVLAAVARTGVVMQRPKWSWVGVPLARQRLRTYGWAALGSVTFGILAVLSVWNINLMQVEMARWLREHTTRDQLIATNDIGALAFLTDRPILDTVGLVEPKLLEHLLAGGTLLEYLQSRDPAYVVIFPNWYPDISPRTDVLRAEHSIRLPVNVVCGGREFIAYRPLWREGRDALDGRVLLNPADGS